MQAYRSGHNEAVLKTVWVKAHGGSNPSACAKNMGSPIWSSHIFCLPHLERDSRVGAVLRERNALPCETRTTLNSSAKDDVNNVGAGRAAKGENPSLCAKSPTRIIGRQPKPLSLRPYHLKVKFTAYLFDNPTSFLYNKIKVILCKQN